MRHNRVVLVATSSLIGLSLALALAEASLRLAGVTSRLVYQPDSRYGWKHTPGDSFFWTTESRELEIQINELGLRDRDHAYEKPAGTSRILVLGDSFVEALQVELEDSFSKVLERNLNDGASGSRVDVINASVSGYGTDNALLFFNHEGYKYSPDIVLLAFYIGNDVRNNYHVLEDRVAGGARKPYFDLGPGGLTLERFPFVEHDAWSTRTRLFLNRHSRLYALFRELRERFRSPARPAAGGDKQVETPVPLDMELFLTTQSSEWDKAWQLTQALLAELRDAAAARGARLFVVMIPTAFQVDDRVWSERVRGLASMQRADWSLDQPNVHLSKLCADERIPCLDLLEPLRAATAGSDTMLYFRQDNHWNESGHREAARLVSRALRDWAGAGGF